MSWRDNRKSHVRNDRGELLTDRKRCLGCDLVLPAEEFSPVRTGYLGRHSRCKTCRNGAHLERYHADPDYRRKCIEAVERSRKRRAA